MGLALRWISRAPRRHARRTLLLVDARAVLWAAAKECSSAPAVRSGIMRVTALALAGDLHLHSACVSSEDNPDDPPSPGILRRWRPQRIAPSGTSEKMKMDIWMQVQGDLSTF